MSRARLLADGSLGLTLILLVPAEVLGYLADPDELLANLAGGTAFVLTYCAVGWLLWRRLPHHPIGWSLSCSAAVSALAFLAHGWAGYALAAGGPPSTITRLAAVFDTYSWIFAVPLGVTIPLLLLPAGQPPTGRRRWVVWTVLAGSIAGAAGLATTEASMQARYGDLRSPLALPGAGPLPVVLAGLGLVTMVGGTLLGVVLLVRRFRRTAGLERQQLRWVAAGGACTVLGIAFGSSSQEPGLRGAVGSIGSAVFFSALPVSIGIAVLRYRLYDLGRLVSRTVSYAVLSALLLGGYVAMVSGASRVVPAESSLAVAASTLAAAALFQPLRVRVQRVVDSRFNRARYDAEHTVAAFTRTLRDEVDLDAVRLDLLRVVEGAVQPAAVGLWLRETR